MATIAEKIAESLEQLKQLQEADNAIEQGTLDSLAK